MKLLISILLLISCVASAQNFYNGYSGTLPTISHPTNVNSAPFLLNQTRTDTMVVTGTGLGSSYFGQMQGQDTAHPFVVYYNNVTGGGVQLENCAYIKVIAIGGNRTQSGGGVPLSITGHADFIQASGFVILNGSAGAIWCKTEAADACKYPNPVQWLYPVHMRNIWITNCRVGNADGTGFSSGDAFYLGSTGSKGDRPVPCLGNQLIKPMYMSGVHALFDTVYSPRRSAIQISGADSGFNEIKNCIIYNIGSEYCTLIANPPYTKQDSIAALSQGAGIRTGYGDGNNVEIAYNHVVKTFLYNLDIETGANVHNNYVDSSGFWANCTSPQQIQNVICYAQQPNSILKLQYNTSAGNNTQPQHKVYTIFGGVNFASSGNIVCGNTPAASIEALPFNYLTTCSNYDTAYKDTTVFIQHDSLVNFHFDSTFRDSIGKVFVPTKPVTSVYKNRHWHVHYVGDSVDVTYRVLVRAAYDSVGYCNLCAAHDTTYRIPIIPQTGWGGFILNGYNGLNTLSSRINYNKQTLLCKYMRENFDFGQSYFNQQFLDSGITPLMTYSPSNAAEPRPFPDLTLQLTKTLDSLFTISSPALLAWINEPSTIQYNDSTGGGVVAANKYLSTYNAACTVAHNHQVLFCDGGITFPIVYQMADYYTRINRLDSVAYLTSVTGIVNFTNAPQKIYWRDFYNTLLPGIRASQADYAQVHWYEPVKIVNGIVDTSITVTSELLTVVLNYVQNQTGKRIISLETGTDNFSQLLFNGMFTEWTKYGAAYITYFLANASGAGNAIPNPTYFIEFKTNNP